ncbi:hypothetical protein LguiA_004726 [Lonicera macranthoides]
MSPSLFVEPFPSFPSFGFKPKLSLDLLYFLLLLSPTPSHGFSENPRTHPCSRS